MIPAASSVSHLRHPPRVKIQLPGHNDFCQSETTAKGDRARDKLRQLCPAGYPRFAHYQGTGHQEKRAVIEVILLEHGIDPRAYLSVLNDFLAAKPWKQSPHRINSIGEPDHTLHFYVRSGRGEFLK
jgi:hypothetical protein